MFLKKKHFKKCSELSSHIYSGDLFISWRDKLDLGSRKLKFNATNNVFSLTSDVFKAEQGTVLIIQYLFIYTNIEGFRFLSTDYKTAER